MVAARPFEAASPIQYDTDPATDDTQVGGYQPGVCNIGTAEIARRRRAGYVGTIAALATYGALVAVGAPPITRLVVALPASIAATGFLQARERFCVAFAAAGVSNFGELGNTDQVTDDAARAADHAKARSLTLRSSAIGLAAGVAAVLLPR